MHYSRRRFIATAAMGLTAASLPSFAQEKPTLRTISYNVLAFRGYPRTPETSANLDAHVADHPEITARALKAYAPNLITLQEAPPEEMVKRFADELAMNYVWFPGGWEGNDDYPGGFPGAVISPFPIVESESRPTAATPHHEDLFTRHLGRAVLETSIGRLHVVSVHFHASDHEIRMQEAAAVTALIAKLKEDAPVLLQGDLNHRPTDSEYAVWTDAGLLDVQKRHGAGEIPTAPSVNPRAHIDYIWATPELANRSTHAEVLNKPPFTTDPSDKSSYALSDHLPVHAVFE